MRSQCDPAATKTHHWKYAANRANEITREVIRNVCAVIRIIRLHQPMFFSDGSDSRSALWYASRDQDKDVSEANANAAVN